MKKFLLFLFLLSPSLTFAYQDLDVPISDDGVVSGFSVNCQNASSTDATALLLYGPNDDLTNPFLFSVYGYMRRPCLDGVATFDSFDLNNFLSSNYGPYSEWFKYVKTPLKLVVKDTTGLYAPDAPIYHHIINLFGGHNGYNTNVLRIENEEYKTLGFGTTYIFDEVNNWWDYVSTSKKAPLQNSSVLFLPGLEASRLYFEKTDCIFNCTDQLWEPNGNSDVADLYLDEDGKSIRANIYTKDIIDESNTPVGLGFAGVNIYKSFINMMDDMVKKREIRQWKAFPYDWREDVFDIVNNGAKTKDGTNVLVGVFEGVLNDLANNSRNGKVTIVSHSNGGLLAKALIYKLQELKDQGKSNLIDRIDKVVFVAVPHIGTPSAIPAMLHGYNQEILAGLIVDPEYPRELGKNMKSAYGLLPSLKYMEKVSTPPIVFDNSIDFEITRKYVEKYGNSIDTFSELNSFLFGDSFVPEPTFNNTLTPIKLNKTMLWGKDAFHTKLDNIVFPDSIKIINFSGWGLETIASFKYLAKKNCPTNREVTCINGYMLDQRPIMTVDGDKTVVSESAFYEIGEDWWVNLDRYNRSNIDRDHKNILEVSDLLNTLKSIFKNENPTENNIVTKTKPIDTENRMQLSVHSPVNIGVYDKLGNFTGKVCVDGYDFCYKQEDIPNSSYLEFGEGKYIDIKEDDYQKTTLTGYDVGTFSFEISKKFPDGTSTTTGFYDIPVTAETKAEVIYNAKSNPVLKVDTNGDGTVDMEIGQEKEFDPIVYLKVIRSIVSGLDLNKVRKMIFIKRIDDIIKLIEKGKMDKAVVKAEKFEKILQKRIDRKDPKRLPKNLKHKRLSKQDAEELLKMFEELLNNIK